MRLTLCGRIADSEVRNAGTVRHENTSMRTPGGDELTGLILAIIRANVELIDVGPLVTRDPQINAVRWLLLNSVAKESKTAAQLGREIGLTRQGALLNVQALHDLHYVQLIDNPGDQRAKKVALTSKGQAKLRQINRFQSAWVNQLAAHFDPVAVRSATELVVKLRSLVTTSVSTIRR